MPALGCGQICPELSGLLGGRQESERGLEQRLHENVLEERDRRHAQGQLPVALRVEDLRQKSNANEAAQGREHLAGGDHQGFAAPAPEPGGGLRRGRLTHGQGRNRRLPKNNEPR